MGFSTSLMPKTRQINRLRFVIWQDFLAFVMWKKPYSHFHLTVFSHFLEPTLIVINHFKVLTVNFRIQFQFVFIYSVFKIIIHYYVTLSKNPTIWTTCFRFNPIQISCVLVIIVKMARQDNSVSLLVKKYENNCSIRWINWNQKLKTKIFFVGGNGNSMTFLYTLKTDTRFISLWEE